MRVLLSVTLAGSLLGGTGATAQLLPSSDATPNVHAVQNGDSNVADASTATAASSLKDLKSGCAVRPIAGVAADVVTWSGRCDQGLAEGQGTLAIWNLGKPVESLTGDFDKGAVRDGRIQIKWPGGSSYDGNAVQSRMDGKGVLTTAAGDRFEGQWTTGHLSGQGSALWANGDRYDGAWRDGKANGHGVQTWSDGRKYEGDWQNDQPNGHGIVTRKDGSRFEADFVDGRPGTPSVLPAVALSDAPAAAAAAGTAENSAQPNVATDDRNSTAAGDVPAHAQPAAIAGIAGKRLLAIDGSSITLTTNDNGIAREISAPNGTSKRNLFAFLNDRVGSVSDGDDGDKVVGVFRLTAKGIVTDYSDGRSEVLYPNDQGGVSLLLNAPSGEAYCMAWYPEGHRFSLDDRKAALAQYASRLGLDEPHRKGAKPAPKASCGTPAAANGNGSLPTQRAMTAPGLVPTPRPDKRAERQPVQTHGATPASFIAPSPRNPDQPVEVRNATIHTIDADAQSVGPNTALASNEPRPVAGASASSCLSVESDGQHWAFRNHCGYDVQFAYCLMNASDPLAACSKGAISGSVARNGASALIADKSLSETNADHDFRWVACGGGAGEVVVHLDRSDPPSGRCVRPDAS